MEGFYVWFCSCVMNGESVFEDGVKIIISNEVQLWFLVCELFNFLVVFMIWNNFKSCKGNDVVVEYVISI